MVIIEVGSRAWWEGRDGDAEPGLAGGAASGKVREEAGKEKRTKRTSYQAGRI